MGKYAPKIERKSKYTRQDLLEAKANGITEPVFHQRLFKGWTVGQAKTTSVRPRRAFTEEELELMEKNNLTKKQINSRISNGMPREVALSIPIGEKWTKEQREKYELEKMKKHQVALIEIKKKEERRLEELKRKKPHLFKVPQTSEFGDYAQQLFDECFTSWS